LFDEGADIVELGGESTRPGAAPVSADEECARILDVVRTLHARRPGARIAVDTTKARVARAALDAGASIINDVSALRLDPALAEVCAAAGGTLVLMHSRGTVADMARYDHAVYSEGTVMAAVIAELHTSVVRARAAGVPNDAIVLDPGIGFAKRGAHSLEALAHLPELVDFGYPVMVGVSRKRFIGELTGVQKAAERDDGTIGANVAALALGAAWFRVHNVRAHRHALDVAYAIFAEAAAAGASTMDASTTDASVADASAHVPRASRGSTPESRR
jgi:dihydropteroate synthase